MITLYSFIMSVLSGSAIVLVLFLCRRSTAFIGFFGLNSLLAFAAIGIIRLCLPFEFHFTCEVNTPALYNPLNNLIYMPLKLPITETIVPGYQLIIIVWISISFILLIHFVFQYIRYQLALSKLPEITCPHVQDTATKIISTRHRNKIKLVPIKTDGIPKTIGIYQAYILLPIRKYKRKELEYIISHEYTHFRQRDGILKLAAQILCIAFWWNPAVYLFRTELDQILEMRCDREMTKEKNQSETRYYLKMIALTAENSVKDKPRFYFSALSGDSSLKQRFTVLLRYRRKRISKWCTILVAIAIILVIFASYAVVLQPYYRLDEVYSSSTPPILASPTEVQENPDGTFTINGKYIISGEEIKTWNNENIK